jgi:hypothetical protein
MRRAHVFKNIVAYLPRARNIEAEKQQLLANGSEP